MHKAGRRGGDSIARGCILNIYKLHSLSPLGNLIQNNYETLPGLSYLISFGVLMKGSLEIKLMHKKNLMLVPFFIILIVYSLFVLYVITHAESKAALEELGVFGDSFGALNTLFSGLGFSGLLITLFVQQRQIKTQENESKRQEERVVLQQYEETLHRLITLYQNTMKEVKIKYEGEYLFGRDALQKSLSIFMDKLKSEDLNSVPMVLYKKYRKNELSADDKEILNYYYYKHYCALNNSLSQQWRLTENLKILLRHLENNIPNADHISQYRELVFSQLTYVECTYFFLIILGGKDNVELRHLMIKSGVLNKFAHIKVKALHKMMFKEFWGVDISNTEARIAFPLGKKLVRELKLRESTIKSNILKLNKKGKSQPHSLKREDQEEEIINS